MNKNIVPAHLAVKAMRDNGYKNAAYALAELIDNSIQALSSNVKVYFGEESHRLVNRTTKRVNEIAILDDGVGMTKETLQIALQFGNGTHLEFDTQDGIGKFGMGLPSSSISQCRRVDVYTWQNGIENALYTYLDLDDIISGKQTEIPEPIKKYLPKKYEELNGGQLSESGTLVIWNRLDRLMWKTFKSIRSHTDFVVGRMYRYYLKDNSVSIKFLSYDQDSIPLIKEEFEAIPNDPLYLMTGTSTPAPYDKEALFEQIGEEPAIVNIEYENVKYPVEITFSIVKQRKNQDGSTLFGKHAKNNVGVSVVRANRELELNMSWVNSYDPRERWWGIEVKFPPALDEVFGVSNNKQSARNFYNLDFNDFKEEGETELETIERLKEENDPIASLIEVHKIINSNLEMIRGRIKSQTTSSSNTENKRYKEVDLPEKKGTSKIDDRISEGYVSESDKQYESLSKAEKEKRISNVLSDYEIDQSEKEIIIKHIIDDGVKFKILKSSINAPFFFDVRPEAGVVLITINVNHPAYDHFIWLLFDDITEADTLNGLKDRLNRAKDAFKLLLMSWARYEDEREGIQRNRITDMRNDWGKIARDFLME